MKNLTLTLAAALLIVTVGCGDSKSPVLTYVARSNSDSIPHLFTLNESNQQVTAVSIPIPDSAGYVASNSDASAVTYCRDIGTNGSDYEIFIMGTDGVEKQLTMNANACESVFSPDGKTMAFVATQSGDFQVYTMNVDGSGQTPIAVFDAGTAEEYNPEFSPDGKSLVFFIAAGGFKSAAQPHRTIHIPAWGKTHARSAQVKSATVTPGTVSTTGWYAMSLSDTAPTLVYATEDLWGPAVFTADGNGLLFTMWDGTQDNIFSVNLDGSSLTPLTTSTDTYNFSPVSYKNVIVFNRFNNDSQSWDIYVMNQDGSNEVLVHSTADTSETLLDSYWYPWFE